MVGEVPTEEAPPTALLALAGRGKVAYPPDVSGAVEVEVAFRTLPKPPGWDHDLHSVCEVRKQTLARAVDHLRQLLDPNDPDSYATTRPDQVGRVHFSLAQLLAYQGEMDPAIKEWLEAYKLAKTNSPQMVPELEEVLGTAYLHKSEMENGVYRNGGERCLFPPRKPVRYQKIDDSEKAIQYFTQFLEKKPDTLEVEWADGHIVLYGWPGSVVTLFHEGKEVGGEISERAPIPSTPRRQ